ncbi:aminoglycoside phosphotransferase family protein [Crossiella sp. NPDC003009]
MTTVPQPSARFEQVRTAAGLRPAEPPRRIRSHSNDTWAVQDERLGAVVLRVSWRGDTARIGREVAVAAQLPAEVRYPEVLGHGVTGELAYSLTRLTPGRPLDECWPYLPVGQRRAAVSQLATMLRALHQWTTPPELTGLLLARPYQPPDRVTALLGADLTPLPADRAVELAQHAADQPGQDPGLLRAAAELLIQLAPADRSADDPAAHGLIHGDLQLGNLLWSEQGELTVLDFEWTRFGPPLLDLQRLCDHADTDALTGVDTHPTVLRWLEPDYPAAFTGPHPATRLRLYGLAYTVRDLLVNPPDHARQSRLRRLVEDAWPAPGALPDSLTR